MEPAPAPMAGQMVQVDVNNFVNTGRGELVAAYSNALAAAQPLTPEEVVAMMRGKLLDKAMEISDMNLPQQDKYDLLNLFGTSLTIDLKTAEKQRESKLNSQKSLSKKDKDDMKAVYRRSLADINTGILDAIRELKDNGFKVGLLRREVAAPRISKVAEGELPSAPKRQARGERMEGVQETPAPAPAQIVPIPATVGDLSSPIGDPPRALEYARQLKAGAQSPQHANILLGNIERALAEGNPKAAPYAGVAQYYFADFEDATGSTPIPADSVFLDAYLNGGAPGISLALDVMRLIVKNTAIPTQVAAPPEVAMAEAPAPMNIEEIVQAMNQPGGPEAHLAPALAGAEAAAAQLEGGWARAQQANQPPATLRDFVAQAAPQAQNMANNLAAINDLVQNIQEGWQAARGNLARNHNYWKYEYPPYSPDYIAAVIGPAYGAGGRRNVDALAYAKRAVENQGDYGSHIRLSLWRHMLHDQKVLSELMHYRHKPVVNRIHKLQLDLELTRRKLASVPGPVKRKGYENIITSEQGPRLARDANGDLVYDAKGHAVRGRSVRRVRKTGGQYTERLANGDRRMVPYSYNLQDVGLPFTGIEE